MNHGRVAAFHDVHSFFCITTAFILLLPNIIPWHALAVDGVLSLFTFFCSRGLLTERALAIHPERPKKSTFHSLGSVMMHLKRIPDGDADEANDLIPIMLLGSILEVVYVRMVILA